VNGVDEPKKTWERKRRVVQVTLSDAARERLAELVERRGLPASRIIEDLIFEAGLPRRRPGT
jgi:hypothetical protein